MEIKGKGNKKFPLKKKKTDSTDVENSATKSSSLKKPIHVPEDDYEDSDLSSGEHTE